jgi:hypothetical protein
MKILLSGNAMDNFSGQPCSTYENAREFAKQGHEVTVVCLPKRWTDNVFKQNLEAIGVKCLYDHQLDNEYDVIYASEWCPDVDGVKIQIVRSEYDNESPINDMDFYVCIRPSIREHIITDHEIPEDKTTVVFNGVDRERFKKREKKKRDYLRIVCPCTIDGLRRRFLNKVISEVDASQGKVRMDIYGFDYGLKILQSKWVTRHDPKFNIEEEIGDADLVVGILLGRVNLEANSCGVPSLIYDPKTLKHEQFFLTEETFDVVHNIKNTIKYLIQIYDTCRHNNKN